MKLHGVSVDMPLDIAPETCKKHVTKDKKKNTKQLIIQCQNAIHGVMTSSLPCCKKFTRSIAEHGFKINPHDPCVTNKMIDGKQMTVCFHVDDCKMSHVKRCAVNKTVKCLHKECESVFEDGSGKMKVSHGKVHTYLGMTLDYRTPGQVQISMFDYIKEILSAFAKAEPKATGTKSSTTPEDLFQVDDDCEKLWPNKAVEFHNLVTKTLCATK